MRIYFSGIGGVGIGPLAQIAVDAGYGIVGSDLHQSPISRELTGRGVTVLIGEQTSRQLASAHAESPLNYFVYTAALPADHPELVQARELGITCLKRDGLLARIVDEKQLTMIAVAGTHGKTSTTGLLVWALQQLGVPISYSVGTTLGFGPSGAFDPDSQYFIYECDEYDRNFLHFTPEISLITRIDYDHPDSYPTRASYAEAFVAFMEQSSRNYLWQRDYEWLDQPHLDTDMRIFDDSVDLSHLQLAGDHLRHNAFLAERALTDLLPTASYHDIVSAINSFPGVSRRMERLADNLYTDYGHHPVEIAATLQSARELNDHVVLVYQPHQNVRQHEIRDDYTDEVFAEADVVYWLPTYLSRENDQLETLTAEQLTAHLHDTEIHYSSLDDELWRMIETYRSAGQLVIVMGAGSIDSWVREQLMIA